MDTPAVAVEAGKIAAEHLIGNQMGRRKQLRTRRHFRPVRELSETFTVR